MGRFSVSINLRKGEAISLDKGLEYALVGLGWSINRYDGSNYDLDAQVFLCNESGKCRDDRDFVFYGNLESGNGAVKHTGDNLEGSDGITDDEVIFIDFTKLPNRVERIDVAVTIYDAELRKQNFGQIDKCYIRVAKMIESQNPQNAVEVLKYEMNEDFDKETALIVGSFYKYKNAWKFKAIGSGWNKGHKALVENYGLEVE